MDDFPSNSRRPTSPLDKSAVTPPSPEAPKLEKVITGKVIHRKKSLGRRFRETFFSGDSNTVFGYLLKDVLVPALQDIVTNVITQGVEKAVYGDVRTPNRSVRGSSVTRPHINYNQPTIINRPPSHPLSQVRRPAVQPSAFQVEEVVFGSQIEAQVVVDKLYETVQEYELVTVANLKELYGETSAYTDHKWGWTDLTEMTVKRIREGYLLVLPPVEDLR